MAKEDDVGLGMGMIAAGGMLTIGSFIAGSPQFASVTRAVGGEGTIMIAGAGMAALGAAVHILGDKI